MHFEQTTLSHLQTRPIAKASRSLAAVNLSSLSSYYSSTQLLVLEEVRAQIKQGLDAESDTFEVAIRSVDASPNPKIPDTVRVTVRGQIPDDQKVSSCLNVLCLWKAKGNTKTKTDPSTKTKTKTNSSKKHDTFSTPGIFAIASDDVTDPDSLVLLMHDRVDRRVLELETVWHAKFVASLVPARRVFEACSQALDSPCTRDLLTASLAAVLPRTALLSPLHPHLNPSQSRAVATFDAASKGWLVLQGPPGTGKTTTITTMIRSHALRRQRLMVSAPSNKAVQVIALKMLQSDPALKMVLMCNEKKLLPELRTLHPATILDVCVKWQAAMQQAGNTCSRPGCLAALRVAVKTGTAAFNPLLKFENANSSTLSDLCTSLMKTLQQVIIGVAALSEAAVDHCSRVDCSGLQTDIVTATAELRDSWMMVQALITQINRKLRLSQGLHFAVVRLISQSSVVFCTLCSAGSGKLLASTGSVSFDGLIVDEAGQCEEAAVLVALQHNPSKVLLVGDTKQLPATILSESLKQPHIRYDRSLMHRLENGHCQANVMMLEEQYRMHPDICSWPSSQYYASQLRTATSVDTSAGTGLTQPIALYNIASGKEQLPAGCTSRRNEVEADYVLAVVRKIRQTDRTSSIGIVSYYKSQLRYISEKLMKAPAHVSHNVVVSTVDGVQGDERDIIILSCVCTSNVGFSKSAERLNVALTRAKKTLVILAHCKLFTSQKGGKSDMKHLIAHLTSKGKVFSENTLKSLVSPVHVSAASSTTTSTATASTTATASGATVAAPVSAAAKKRAARQSRILRVSAALAATTSTTTTLPVTRSTATATALPRDTTATRSTATAATVTATTVTAATAATTTAGSVSISHDSRGASTSDVSSDTGMSRIRALFQRLSLCQSHLID